MSVTRTSSTRRSGEHFEPQLDDDPQVQRRLRGQLEQIDYTAFASNRDILGQALGQVDIHKFQRMAVATACARAAWVGAAMAAAESGHSLTPEQTARLAQLRLAFEELTEAYEAMRRMVERGYLSYRQA
ncbi:hypothetical protein [Phenylobacterium montanum]|uniref:Uncharacterized protein n=1 Tax=Phenylobacterium montanum TaxID=2823693 RepID=A0A975IUA6_9CAUL|nr:hypothetical protein [Caulobacter sp. S6]QUD87603.1 hypothetical protein KCG34_21545 [Caulobacter sp. S6]